MSSIVLAKTSLFLYSTSISSRRCSGVKFLQRSTLYSATGDRTTLCYGWEMT